MSRVPFVTLAVVLLAGPTAAEQPAIEPAEQCDLLDEAGPWSTMLQRWAVSDADIHGRRGRVMSISPGQGYYVTDRVDGLSLAPPPPPQHSFHGKHPNHPNYPPLPPPGRPYDEWQHAPPLLPSTGKIVNRPPNPYKDKFKPSHPAPALNQPIPVHSAGSVDRIDENKQPPQKLVSDTALYLLSAIEKLVYRADLMEKRLRKMEETVHYLVAGIDAEPEPCATNFTRVGAGCYHVSSEVANWKGANYACKHLKASMLEINTDEERRKLTSALLADKRLKEGEFWTGGLNPGLLWIWPQSAQPIISNGTRDSDVTIGGEGRCLAWLHEPAGGGFRYRGQDCGLRHRYICETHEEDTKLSNDIERVARKMREGRKPTLTWSDGLP